MLQVTTSTIKGERLSQTIRGAQKVDPVARQPEAVLPPTPAPADTCSAESRDPAAGREG